MKPPKDDAHYAWTHHVWEKMQFYGLSESRIKRVIRFPARTEEGIAPRTVAVMQSAGTSKYQEIWVMYKIQRQEKKDKDKKSPFAVVPQTGGKLKVITAWRYPGKSPERDPVPSEIIAEVQRLL